MLWSKHIDCVLVSALVVLWLKLLGHVSVSYLIVSWSKHLDCVLASAMVGFWLKLLGVS